VGRGGGSGQADRLLSRLPLAIALDTDRDSSIGNDEMTNAPAALRGLDRNGDGRLSESEFLPQLPGGRSLPFALRIVTALDANGDGTIDASEIDQAATRLKSLDANRDGQLAADEIVGEGAGGHRR
jgi:hypothetical protein